ncbi:MAG: DJ-1/PfpI family protein [Acidobacteria bacterium]|nr:DJ-1/PfpI family protein [Acidobacteriota bacterium]
MKNFSAFVLSFLIILVAVPSLTMAKTNDETGAIKPKVLILLGEWFGDAYFPLKEKLEALGWEYYRVGVDEAYRGCYNKKRDIELKSDILIPELKDLSQYDVLIIPSGPQYRKFIANDVVLNFVKKAYDSGLVVATFCTGNIVANKAGLLEDNSEWEYDVFPPEITIVKDRLIIGPRGGGPPPGDGYKSVPYDAILKTIADELNKIKK